MTGESSSLLLGMVECVAWNSNNHFLPRRKPVLEASPHRLPERLPEKQPQRRHTAPAAGIYLWTSQLDTPVLLGVCVCVRTQGTHVSQGELEHVDPGSSHQTAWSQQPISWSRGLDLGDATSSRMARLFASPTRPHLQLGSNAHPDQGHCV
ncbi:hypothetical protein CapIbe_008883 [Capra ibex]